MGKKPKGATLDRIDNNGKYCKDNCKWSTQSEQQRNKRKKANTTSKYYGVNFYKGKFVVMIQLDNKRKYLGYYPNEILASQAYDMAAFMYLKDRRFRNREITNVAKIPQILRTQ